MMRTLITVLMMVTSWQCGAEWPTWLGERLQHDNQAQWEINAKASEVTFSPRGENPTVWILISKKAESYDTALSTILNVFRREMPTVTFQVSVLPESRAALVHWTRRAEKEASLIYVVGSKATVSLHQVYAGRELPVVSVNAKDPVLMGLIDNYQTSGNNFAFTSLNLPSEVTLSFLRRFRDNLSQIGVLYAKSNTSAYLTQYLPLKIEAERQGISVFPIEVDESLSSHTLRELMTTQVAAMRGQDDRLEQSLLWLTGSSSLLTRLEEINSLSEGLPLLTAVPNAVNGSQHSALMSVGVEFENNAQQAAHYGMTILKSGTDPADLPVGVLSPPDISISFLQAERVDVQVPFVLLEMASDIYDSDGTLVRSAGISMEVQQ